ncbi:TetR/AcrR family transcriptional regulator [Novosphingobium colocasiae]|uniref:TetR/AcrR family transcriptional regulator n=1 Tax=Novosphingobium colocasiae TaxID=1256513 RepID=UPI0035B11A37
MPAKSLAAEPEAAPSNVEIRWNALLTEVLERRKPPVERKQARSKRTEQQILNAALRVFARDGISRSRIADIAAEAGISTSTLYDYYKSKEDLAYELPQAHMTEFSALFAEAATEKLTTKERLSLYLTMSADYAREHSEWARLLYLEIWPSVFVSETELKHTIDDFARVILFLIKEGMEEGWISRANDPYETAALLIGGINQVIITWLLYRKPRNLTKAGSEMAARMIAILELEAAQAQK